MDRRPGAKGSAWTGGVGVTLPPRGGAGQALPGVPPGMIAPAPQLHPLVPPQVLHFMQVPLRTSVKLPHSPQASPS